MIGRVSISGNMVCAHDIFLLLSGLRKGNNYEEIEVETDFFGCACPSATAWGRRGLPCKFGNQDTFRY
jgi:hypothetical protein